MEYTKYVCVVCDMQGFYFSNKFFPKEIAFYNDDLKICFEVDCALPLKLFKKNWITINYQTKRIHGLPVYNILCEKSVKLCKENKLETLIKLIYNQVKTDEKPIIAVKNPQTASILRSYKIPTLDFNNIEIDGLKCPTYKIFEEINSSCNIFCDIHYILYKKFKNKNHICSFKKSYYIWNWIKITNESLLLANSLKEKIS